MATYQELDQLAEDPTLLAQFRTAVRASANVIADAYEDHINDPVTNPTPPTDEEIRWAGSVLREAKWDAERALGLFLWDKKGQTVADIQNTAENQIKNRVERMVPFLIKRQAVA